MHARTMIVLALAALLVVDVSAFTMGDAFKKKHVQTACKDVVRTDSVATSTIILGGPTDGDWEADTAGSDCKGPYPTKVKTSKTFKAQKCKKVGSNWENDGAEFTAQTIRACAKDGNIGHLRWQDISFRFERTSTLLRHNN